ncbi:MAG: DUF1957 domain-containing protein [Anaerolineae bacterium]|nr:DUF1957 domain-containing protein [Anaerolineae bacterium]
MAATGAFTLVLHGHIPYVRMRYFRGEAWLHEALLFSYLPLLEMLYTLHDEAAPAHLTLSFSPVLLEQLAHPDIAAHFDAYVADRTAAADADIAYYEGEAYNEHLRYLAVYQRSLFEAARAFYHDRLHGDFIGGLRLLQESGMIEIAASAATHAYLPLLSRRSSLHAQIHAGLQSYERLFGRRPTSFMLPDHGYRPGLEDELARHGVQVFFVEGHAVRGGDPTGAATGEVLGGLGAVKRQYAVGDRFFADLRSSLSTRYAYTVGSSSAAVLGRSHSASYQVWGETLGYPGDFDYRDFHRKAGTSRLHYWRVTGKNVGDAQKDYYHPDWASYKIEQHAEHFAHMVGDLLRGHYQRHSDGGIVMVSYPMELFGWRWHEGVSWLDQALRQIGYNHDIQMTTATEAIRLFPPTQSIDLLESSWGAGGRHFNWNNIDTAWMWEEIARCEARMEALAARHTQPTEAEALTLAQAAREALLLQSGDWQLLISTGEARMFAMQRFAQHIEAFDYLAESLDAGEGDAHAAQEFFERDHIFADIDYTWFRPRS